jgi:hypothetical protein
MNWPDSESAHDPTGVDSAYDVYYEHPLDESDEWGDLASFLDAASAS